MSRSAARPAPRARRSPAVATDAIDGRLDVAIVAVLVVVTLALYAPVRTHKFVDYDDNEYVTENPAVRAGLTRASLAWALTSVHQATWHPLTSISHLLDVEAFGMNPGAHLLVNVGLHTLATVLLFLVLRRLTGARWPSAWVAALFAWHPLHVESVAWVSERKDVLSAVFWMLTLASYAAYVRRPAWSRYGVLLVVFGLGLLAKPMLVTLPAVLLLLDHWPLGRLGGWKAVRARVREKVPLLALVAIVSVVTYRAQQSAGALGTLASVPLSYRVGNALVSYVTYLRKTIWPSDLAVFYPASANLPWWQAAAAGSALVVATVLVVRAGRRVPALVVGWLWYLGTLVPVLGLVRQGEQAMADRFTYLPLIGVFIMAAWGAPALLTAPASSTAPARLPAPALGPAGRRILAGVAGLAAAACVVASARQIAYWENSLTLFTHALAVTEDNHVAESNLGVALAERGRYDEARAHYARAVAIAPEYAKARVNLGQALARAGDHAAAEREYAEAARLDPRSATAEYNWGLLRAERGALDAAIEHYRRALAIDPGLAKAHNNLGWALAAQGKLAEAVASYEQALRLEPDLTAAHNNLAVALEGLERPDEALAHYRAAVVLAPDEPRAHANYGALLAARGRSEEAITEYLAALELAPDFIEVRAELADAYARTGRLSEARAQGERALAAARAAERAELAAAIAARLQSYGPATP